MASVLRNGTVLSAEGWRAQTDVRIDNGFITRISPGLAAAGAEEIDCTGLLVVPGFVDIHVHGAAGAMCEDADAAGIAHIAETLARCGVTSFLATIATLPPEHLRAAVAAIAAAADSAVGARILGIHLEGPYLNPQRAGAQAGEWMRTPAVDEFDALQEHAGGRIRLITIAPEVDGALPFIAAMRARGVGVALGHSAATAEEALRAVDAGAAHVVHLFNAMRALHHREPGLVGTALSADEVSVELICDGHHLAPLTVDLVFRRKPLGKVVLVSDAVGALGRADGNYAMWGIDCTVRDGAVRVRQTGALAGSCAGLDRCVRNVRRWLPELPLAHILAAAASAPAAVIGETQVGSLAEGRRADLVLLDASLEVVSTICRGVVVWRR